MTFAVIVVGMGLDTGGWCRAASVSVAVAPVCRLPLGERQFGAHAVVAVAIRRPDANAAFDGRAVAAAAVAAVGSAGAERPPTAAVKHYLHCITQIG